MFSPQRSEDDAVNSIVGSYIFSSLSSPWMNPGLFTTEMDELQTAHQRQP